MKELGEGSNVRSRMAKRAGVRWSGSNFGTARAPNVRVPCFEIWNEPCRS
jgi:hypothetical protein